MPDNSKVPKNYTYITCRTFGHAWSPTLVQKREVYGRRLLLECERCSMVRMDGISATNEVITRSYDQPKGYKLSREHSPSRLDFRGEWVRRQTGKSVK